VTPWSAANHIAVTGGQPVFIATFEGAICLSAQSIRERPSSDRLWLSSRPGYGEAVRL
jgi:hypothetical protein